MKTALLIIAAIVLAVAALLVTRPAAPENEGRLLARLAPEKISTVSIRAADGNVTLQHTEKGWTVADRGGYPADNERVLRLIRTIWELRPVQTLTVAESDLPRLELNLPPEPPPPAAGPNATQSDSPPQPAGTLIEFRAQDGSKLGGLVIGKRHMREGQGGFPGMAAGRYVRATDASARVALVTHTFDDAAPAPQTWLDRQFLRIEDPVAISWRPAGGNASQGWKLAKDEGAWKLAEARKNETLDDAKATSAASALSGLTFTDLGPESFEPSGTLEVKTGSGLLYTFQVGPREGGEVPVLISAEKLPDAGEQASLENVQRFLGRTFLVPGYALDSLAVDRQKLMVEPPPNPTPEPAPSPTPARPPRRR